MAEKKPDTTWEEDFFKKHGITDDKEKDAIRGRSRVLAYRDAQRKAEEAESANQAKPKRWFDD